MPSRPRQDCILRVVQEETQEARRRSAGRKEEREKQERVRRECRNDGHWTFEGHWTFDGQCMQRSLPLSVGDKIDTCV